MKIGLLRYFGKGYKVKENCLGICIVKFVWVCGYGRGFVFFLNLVFSFCLNKLL